VVHEGSFAWARVWPDIRPDIRPHIRPALLPRRATPHKGCACQEISSRTETNVNNRGAAGQQVMSSAIRQRSRRAMKNGAERPRFFAFTMLSSEVDRGVARSASDTLEIHQRQLDDFRFFFLDDFDLLFHFDHLPSPEISNDIHWPHRAK
jgi:hypothetical protein